MKKRILQAIIVIIFMFAMIFIAKNENHIILNEDSKEITSFAPPVNTSYFIIATPKGEYIISGLSDTSEIYNKLNFNSYSYELKGDFDYEMILSCVNISQLSEANLLIKDNYMVNGNRIFKLDFNIENYLRKISKHYSSTTSG